MGGVEPRATGQTVGGWVLIRRIHATPGFERWLAHPTGKARADAVAAIDLPTPGDAAAATALRRRAELVAAIAGAGVQRILDTGESDGAPWVVVPPFEGATLEELRATLQELRVRDERAWTIAIGAIVDGILAVLERAHAVRSIAGAPFGIVHGALGPGWVWVTTAGDIVVDGFGEADRPREATSGVDAHVQLRYAAPEQLSARTRVPAMDLFTVGALVHELLDGRPFRGEKTAPVELLALARAGEVGELATPAPAELDALRKRLLSREPTPRGTAAQAREMLAKPLAGREAARTELARACAELRAPPPSEREEEPEPARPSAAGRPPIDEGTLSLDGETLARMRAASARMTTPVVTAPAKPPRESAVHVRSEVAPAAVVEPTEFVPPPPPPAAARTPVRAPARAPAPAPDRRPDPEGTAFHVAAPAPARTATMLAIGAVLAVVLGVVAALLLID